MKKSFAGEPIKSGAVEIFVNPGTGPVEGATLENAQRNIARLIEDCGFSEEEVKVLRVPKWDEDGRFRFELSLDKHICQIDMPGLSLEEVRYMDSERQNIWNYPRLYVDGSSWVWKYAINCTRASLTGEEEG